jgi:hypothetical protein
MPDGGPLLGGVNTWRKSVALYITWQCFQRVKVITK